MDLQIKGKLFIVCGASSGFGYSVASALLKEGAKTILVARSEEHMLNLQQNYNDNVEIIKGDLQRSEIIEKIVRKVNNRKLDGVFINAGGPPPALFEETSMNDWDDAYRLVLRWKIELIHSLLPIFRKQKYGRILALESVSAKQPVENLILSNSYRLAVVGALKTISQEVASDGITVNVIGPGYHDTDALKRLFKKKAAQQNIAEEKAREVFTKEVPVGRLGDPDELASLAVWLLSPVAGYVTGQTIDIDGGINRSVFG